jgi:hypothetical protein
MLRKVCLKRTWIVSRFEGALLRDLVASTTLSTCDHYTPRKPELPNSPCRLLSTVHAGPPHLQCPLPAPIHTPPESQQCIMAWHSDTRQRGMCEFVCVLVCQNEVEVVFELCVAVSMRSSKWRGWMDQTRQGGWLEQPQWKS